MDEQWRPLIGYEECYAISDLGRVARTLTYGKCPKPMWRILTPRIKPSGYTCYHPCKNGIITDHMAHRLVWRTFRGEIPDDREVNHINSNRSDPRLSNLELMTRSENAAYAFSHNNRPAPNNPCPGSQNGSAKLSEKDIPIIRSMLADGLFQYEIAGMYGVSQPTVGAIALGRTWQQV